MSPTEMRNASKKQNLEAALITAERNRLEMAMELEAERQGNAIRRSNFFRPHRPRRPAGFMPPVAAQGR